MSGKWTPGPWEIVEDSRGFLNIHGPREDGHLADLIATIFQDVEHARLIAAAPDLAKAMSQILRWTDDFHPESEADAPLALQEFREAVEACAHAALQKAGAQ